MSTQTAAAARFAATWRGRQRRGSGGSEAQRGWDRPPPWADRIPCAARLSPLLWCARDMRAESALAHGEQEKTGMFEVPPLCENESDDAPNGSYDLISSFGTYTDRKRHGSSPKKWTQNSGVNPLVSLGQCGVPVPGRLALSWDAVVSQEGGCPQTRAVLGRSGRPRTEGRCFRCSTGPHVATCAQTQLSLSGIYLQ